ncbi:S-disulfanyl-L-cysteine oxidoreductase SoxD [Burkholderiaceae bacterium]|nr:S-disulfanyl-L-cysteine oxidoreductase SoxD [Burkholderiaceae bacterium]
MHSKPAAIAALLAGFMLGAPPALAEPSLALGLPVDAAELDRISITVYPNGRGLPAGSGSVREGKQLYAQQCAACHGAKGIEGPASRLAGSDGFIAWNDPLRILRIRKQPLLVLSVGAQWPYATSLFDYVRRAMPHHAPKSLGSDEVYAVTAYVLRLNGLLDDDATLDRASLPRIVMPGLARGVSAWPMESAGGAASGADALTAPRTP